jgi:hypothetical protein
MTRPNPGRTVMQLTLPHRRDVMHRRPTHGVSVQATSKINVARAINIIQRFIQRSAWALFRIRDFEDKRAASRDCAPLPLFSQLPINRHFLSLLPTRLPVLQWEPSGSYVMTGTKTPLDSRKCMVLCSTSPAQVYRFLFVL